MKGKQLFILLLLAALAGGAWYFVSERNRKSWSGSGSHGGKVIEFPINDVAHLRIKSVAGEVNLVRKAETWTVQERADYPANFEQVGSLVRKLWELKTVQEVKVGASQLPRLELDEPGKGDKAGTLVELLGADDKRLGALVLGKKQMQKPVEGGGMDFGGSANGRYVKVVGGEKVSLVSEAFEDAEPKPENWLLKDFVKIDGPKSIVVTGPTPERTWTVTRENPTAEWKLADAKPEEKMDSSKTFGFGSILSSSNIDDVLAADAKPEETGLDKPTTAKVETFDGFTYELKIGRSNSKNIPVFVSVSADLAKERTPGKDEKPEDKAKLDEEFKAKQKRLEEKLATEQKFAGRGFLVPPTSVDSILKDRAALFPDKPAEPAPAAGGPPPSPEAFTPPVRAPMATPPAPPTPPGPKPAEKSTPKPAPKASPKP